MITFIQFYYPQLKKLEKKHISKEHISDALADDRHVFENIESTPVYRSFPSKANLSPNCTRFLKGLLSHKILPFDPDDPVAKECNENGWIHTDARDQHGTELVCFLPTRIHEK